jgi:hypothetical protein
MNTTFPLDAASGAEAANQAPTITSAIIEAEQTTTEAISSWTESVVRLAPVILQGFAGVLAVLYLLGVTFFCALLLFHTFSR